MKFSSIILAAVSLVLVNANVTKRGQEICAGQVTVSETFIGEDNNVMLSQIQCPDNTLSTFTAQSGPDDVCGDTCTTSCFNPSGGGPNPNDCQVIVDAMRFYSQNVNDTFVIGTGANNVVALTYSSCETFYVNQETVEQSYCFSDWATIVNYVAFNCQATQNAHGGLCVADDQEWFIQVQAA